MDSPLWFANSDFLDLTLPCREGQSPCLIGLDRLHYLHSNVLNTFTKGIEDYLPVGDVAEDFVPVHLGSEGGKITTEFHQNERDVVVLVTIFSPQKG